MGVRQRCATAIYQLLQAGSASNGPLAQQHAQSWLGLAGQTFSTHASSSCWGAFRSSASRHNPLHQLHRGFAGGSGQQPAARSAARAAPKPAGTSTAASSPAGAGAGKAAAAAAGAGAGNAAAGAAAGAASGAQQAQLSPFQQWWRRFQRIPTVPKVLGLTGAIPFIALAPPVCKHLEQLLPTTISENCAMIQVCYGVVIVTFLGAVHWGVAMASPLTSPVAARIANEAFVYSVIPSLVAWPVAVMEPGAASLVLSLLLPGCYLADYTRRNLGMPAWYMTLRVPLTLLATFGMLLTATRHVHAEVDRMKVMQQQEAAAAGQQA